MCRAPPALRPRQGHRRVAPAPRGGRLAAAVRLGAAARRVVSRVACAPLSPPPTVHLARLHRFIPDDVLAAMEGLEGAAIAAAPVAAVGPDDALPPPAAPAFHLLPPGPLLHEWDARNNSSVPVPGPPFGGLQAPTAQQLPQQHELPAEHGGGAADVLQLPPHPHHAALGEAQVLRARLERAEQQAQHDRLRVTQLQNELQQARADKDAKFESRLRHFQSELSFKEAEVQQLTQAKAHAQAQLEDMQAAILRPLEHQLVGESAAAVAVAAAPRAPASARHTPAAARTNAAGASASCAAAVAPPAGAVVNGARGASPLFQSRPMRPSPSASLRKRHAPGASPTRHAPPASVGAAPLRDRAPMPPPPSVAAGAKGSSTALHASSAAGPPFTTGHEDGEPPHDDEPLRPAPQHHHPQVRLPTEPSPQPPYLQHPPLHPSPAPLQPQPHSVAASQDFRSAGHAQAPAVASVVEAQGVPSTQGPPRTSTVEASSLLDPAQHDGSRLLSRLLSRPDSALQRLLLDPPNFRHHDDIWSSLALSITAHNGAELKSQLLQAMQLVMCSEDSAPRLVRTLVPFLEAPSPQQASAMDPKRQAVWQLLCALLVESGHCRDAVLRPDGCPATAGGATCAHVMPALLRWAEELASDVPQAIDLILPALEALEALVWSEPAIASLPWVERWLGPCESTIPMFSVFLGPAMSAKVRLAAHGLLRHVLRTERAFEAFVTPAPPRGAWASPAYLVVQALGARKPTADKQPRPQSSSGVVEHDSRPCSVAPHIPDRLLCDAGGTASTTCCNARDATGAAQHTHSSPDSALRHAALLVISALLAQHAGAAARLLSPEVGLALPMRLVSTLQSNVHSLLQLQGREAPPTDLEVVRATVLLLLELARGTSMQQALEGGSWSADLTSATLHLVRSDVHPDLAHLSMPAKILQNTAIGS